VAPPIPTTHQLPIPISRKKKPSQHYPYNPSPQLLLNTNIYIFCDGWINSEIHLLRPDSTSPKKHFPQLYRAEDEERRLLPKRQTAGWRNERKGQATEKSDNITQTSIS
jgi:hypothetical protein